ncbi:MAG: ABC transporter permease [Gammaproteobacteria bacterium]|nr:MAG: ABC transporter permease [Gammaproteobacteria bacterium]
MVTGFITVLLILALIGSIYYESRLVKTEKIDAVFGDPDRAKGGVHWIIAGSSTILLLWLFFSWDIAKSFYPGSANELCQVAKVRESLVGIKYIFPIDERQLKSTSVIDRETAIINDFKKIIQNSNIHDSDKDKLISLLNETELMIITLTNEKYLESEVTNKVKNIANRLTRLKEEFVKASYPPIKSVEEENERIELLKNQTSWGETGMEIPPLPETKTGLKFDAAAKEIKLISEEFFEIKNNNSVYLVQFEKIKNGIKSFKNSLNDDQELEKEYIRQVSKIAGRLSRGKIFPPDTLDSVQQSLIDFDEVQRKEQGGIGVLDTLLFPGGTIVASGDVCSEQGPGRWLPKPSDTFKIFTKLLKPSEGYKNVPLIWYEMMGVNQVVGFITPDWIADIIPGKYPVHGSDGKVESNLKSTVLDIATGNFEAFAIPIPSGHIWDSFLRVILGLGLGIICGVPLGLFMGLSRFAAGYFDPIVELYRPVPPLAWAPLIITIFGIDNSGKIFLLFMVSFAIMVISARAGASGTQLSKIHAAHSLGASKWQILREVILPNSLPEILTGIRVAIGVCWGTLVAAEFLAGTTGIGFVENVARKYSQYEVIWITIFVMGMLGLLFDIGMRKIIKKTIPWRGKG